MNIGIYPKRHRLIYILFDIAFLYYLIAYFVYYQDEVGFATIRLTATAFILLMGFGIRIVTKDTKINKYNIWYFLFIAMCFFSVMWAEYDKQVISVMPSLIRVLFIGFFLAARIKKDLDIEVLLFYFIISVMYLNLYVGKMMIDFYSFEDFYLYRFGDNFSYNSNTIAILNVLGILTIIHWLKQVKKPVIRWGMFLFLALFLVVLVFTGSKKGLLGLLFGIFLFFYQRVKGRKKFERIFLGLVVVVAIIWCVMNISFLYDILGYRFDEMFQVLFKTGSGDGSSRNRVSLIQEAIAIWASHPVLGVGLNNFSMIQDIGEAGYYAHNNYVELLADLGVVGFFLYYGMFVNMIRQKIDNKNDLQVFAKTVVWIILFFDIGSVSYQDIRIQIFVCLSFVVLVKIRNKVSMTEKLKI